MSAAELSPDAPSKWAGGCANGFLREGLVRKLFASGLADAPTSLSVLAEVVWWLAWWCETAGFGTVRCRASVNVPFINGN